MNFLLNSKVVFFLSFLLLLGLKTEIKAQSNFEKAQEQLKNAIKLMDDGNINQSIDLLKEARKLDPKNYEYDYEIGYALYLKRDFKEALKTLKYVVYNFDNCTDKCYQLLGNLYDINGKPKKALKVYDEGLVKFPKSGRLYLEKGITFLLEKNYNEALNNFEKGIQVEPNFASNYYRAALIYCNSSEAVWGMIYGEIFINLERGTRRTDEMSRILYQTYFNKITIIENKATAQFSKNATIYIDPENFDAEKFKLPFGIGFYDPTILLALTNSKQLNLEELNKIRTSFLNLYNTDENRKRYPNALFEHQLKIQEKGFLEAYNYWVLHIGNETEFEKWKNSHTKEWKQFLDWFIQNPLQLDEKSVFHRSHY